MGIMEKKIETIIWGLNMITGGRSAPNGLESSPSSPVQKIIHAVTI